MSDCINSTSENEELVVSQPLKIFCTNADKYENDIFAMSDFFGGYIKQLSLSLGKTHNLDVISDIPISDISIVGDVIRQAEIIAKGNTTWVPDFDSLPSGILSKLKKGIYTIGQSKQVEGNCRATILDENGVRVKDITLKKVPINPGNIETVRSIGNQMQMR